MITIEGNWCDRPDDALIDENNRRYSALAMLLRARFLVDVDCWSEVRGQPIKRRASYAKSSCANSPSLKRLPDHERSYRFPA